MLYIKFYLYAKALFHLTVSSIYLFLYPTSSLFSARWVCGLT